MTSSNLPAELRREIRTARARAAFVAAGAFVLLMFTLSSPKASVLSWALTLIATVTSALAILFTGVAAARNPAAGGKLRTAEERVGFVTGKLLSLRMITRVAGGLLAIAAAALVLAAVARVGL